MKFSGAVTMGMFAGALARGIPRPHVYEDDPLAQRTLITSLVIYGDGKVAVECRETSASTESFSVRTKDGSKASAYRSSIFTSSGKDDEVSVDVTTFPPHSDIYPPAPGSPKANFLFYAYPCYYRMMSGGITINNYYYGGGGGGTSVNATDDDEPEEYYFGPDNGDNWFYFEDARSSDEIMATAEEPPVRIIALSGGNTQMLGISHTERPETKKIHDGPCDYTGIRTPAPVDDPKSINVNVQIQEL